MKILSNDYLSNIPGIDRPAQGGTANFARGFSAYVKKRGHEWHGIIIATSKKMTYPRIIEIKKGRGEYHKMLIPSSKIKSLSKAQNKIDPESVLSKEIKRLVELIKEIKPDIVLINGIYSITWPLMMAAKEAEIPIVVQHAGIFKKEVEVYKDVYTSAGKEIMEKVEKDSSLIADAEVFLNKWSLDNYKKAVYPVSNKKAYIIPIPFDYQALNTSKNKKNDKIRIGSVARWDRIKNHTALLKLAREIKKEGLNWKISSVTKIPKTKINKKFKEDYRSNIEIIPPMNRDGVLEFIGSMDIMLLPSFFETASFVVLESLACGTPIIISPTTGFAPTFKKLGASQYIDDFKDPIKVIKKIKRLSNKEMPAQLIKHIKSQHKPSKVFKAYMDLFNKVITK
jgi:glycosyltransferase involved in cell wall biosynthesis